MADGSGGGAGLGVIVGGLLVVVVAVVSFLAFSGNFTSTKSIDVNVHAPAMSAPSAPAPK